jgi:predicted DsbA family dithiol-disulfide isomerase
MHAGAEPAARAYLCAPDEQRDALADRLYGAAFGMQRDTVLAMAADLGIDRQALESCYDAPATSERLERDQRLFEVASLRGLPSTFVGPVLIEGAEVDDFHAALRHELSGAGGGALWAFAALAAAVLAAVMASLLTARGARAAPA